MKHKSIVNAVNKLGLKIETNDNGQQWVIQGDHVLSWYIQGTEAVCVHMCRTTDESDPHTDYFPGSFAYTLKRAINYIRGAE